MVNTILPFIFSALASYLLGSISFSIIFTKLFEGNDIRKYGSGNAGTTNVLRTAGRMPALLTLIGDFSKVVLAVKFAQYIFFLYPVAFISPSHSTLIKFIAGFFCILGHIYPLYFGFKGGKGVLTSAALVLLIDWRVFLIAIAVFAIVLAVSKIVSFSSLTAAAFLPVLTLIFQISDGQKWQMVLLNTIFAAFITAILFYKHISNIRRLVDGTETKLGNHAKGA